MGFQKRRWSVRPTVPSWLLVLAMLGSSLGLPAYGQFEGEGTVVFGNSSSTRVWDASTGQPVMPGTVKVGLYYSTNLGVFPYPSVPEDDFVLARVASIFIAGVFLGGTVTLPGTVVGQMVLVQVRVWSAAYDSYAEAVRNMDPLLGVSNLMGVTLGGGILPPPSLVIQGRLQPIYLGDFSSTNAPVAIADSFTVLENSTLSGQLNGWDRDGDTLVYAAASWPALGDLSIQPNGQFTYTPRPGSQGADVFSFMVNDGLFDSPPAAIAITVLPNFGTMVFNNGSSSLVLDGRSAQPVEAGVAVAGLYVSTDLGATPLPGLPGDSFRLVSTAPISDGRFNGGTNYIPGTRGSQRVLVQIRCWPSGLESFEKAMLEPEALVGVSDVIGPLLLGHPGLSGPQLAAIPQLSPITLRFLHGAHPPTALASLHSGYKNVPLSGTVMAIDPDGDPLTYSLAGLPAHGTVTLQADGSFVYVPETNYTGSDSFAFLASDGELSSAPAFVTLQVRDTDNSEGGQVYFANTASFILSEDTSLSRQLTATDTGNHSLAFSIVSPPVLGLLDLSPTGAFVYSPHPDVFGTDTFTFRVSDGAQNSAPAMVTLTILPVNDPPTVSFEVYPTIPWIAGYAHPIALSPNNSNAVVVLDGSISGDTEGDALDYGWFEDAGVVPFALGATALVTLEVGAHTIRLQADDGSQFGEFETTLEVVTPGAAVEDLILQVAESALEDNRKNPLLALLKSAVASLDRGSFVSGIHQLEAFRHSIEAKLKNSDPDLARQWADIALEVARVVAEE